MLGQIVWRESALPVQVVEVGGLRMLQGGLSGEGRFYRWRLKKLLREFRRRGVRRLLVPRNFEDWHLASKMGIRRVDPLPFLRSNGAELLLLAMERRGYCPENCRVALRGSRVGREMVKIAQKLVPRVRDLSISAPVGGISLQNTLRQQWGLGVVPDGDGMTGVICMDEGGAGDGAVVLTLFGDSPNLGGLVGNEENFSFFLETEPLSLMAALWESGNLDGADLEFYLT